MKTVTLSLRRPFTTTLLAAFLLVAAPSVSFALSGWGSSYSSGISRAKSASKPLLVVIAKTGCEACEQLESNLSRTNSSLKSAVRVRVEADANPSLTSRYAGGGTPTILVFTKENGYRSPIYSYTGVMSSGEIRQLGRSLDSIASQAKKRR